ncbi:MAG: hypothetical protein AAGI69_21360 [Cyanobacteria bacterium P01_H01_bin.21]
MEAKITHDALQPLDRVTGSLVLASTVSTQSMDLDDGLFKLVEIVALVLLVGLTWFLPSLASQKTLTDL